MQTPVTWETVSGHTGLPLSISTAGPGEHPNLESSISPFCCVGGEPPVPLKPREAEFTGAGSRGASVFLGRGGRYRGLRAGPGGLAHPREAGAGGTPGFTPPSDFQLRDLDLKLTLGLGRSLWHLAQLAGPHPRPCGCRGSGRGLGVCMPRKFPDDPDGALTGPT